MSEELVCYQYKLVKATSYEIIWISSYHLKSWHKRLGLVNSIGKEFYIGNFSFYPIAAWKIQTNK